MNVKLAAHVKLFKKEIPWYLFLLPSSLAMLLFTFYPLFKTLMLSMYYSRNGTLQNFVGWLNYSSILKDHKFWNALYNTVHMGFFTILINIPVAFTLACLINSLTKGKNVFKMLYFLPNVTSIVAVTLVFKVLFYPTEAGTVNYMLSFLGIEKLGWLTDYNYSKWVVIVMGLWHNIGYSIIIFIAGLQTISQELYEAAEVDGASRFQKWYRITIPLTKPIFTFMLIMGTISALERFSDVFSLGGAAGSPLRSLQTVVAYFYENGMLAGQYGVGAAASVVIFVLILIVTTLNLWISKTKETE
ncbi:carbohydrate ABC transporter permease [Paenibacillus cremeus]|uniref:Sugar ABC transporter permease n=1 Tax=Paenibacillus cremeus TaxID=2163881 RepID=A0A559JFE8_9BACL|nr:sugar ABC transporter permease [Paenibacillus cremeus]TVX98587.1 sugar ABC transporter permease [Paenibacillus cremeus]